MTCCAATWLQNVRLTLLKCEEGLIAYLAVNTLRLHYKNQCRLGEMVLFIVRIARNSQWREEQEKVWCEMAASLADSQLWDICQTGKEHC
jgi:hypothetical protein